MKKILFFMLSIFFVFSLLGCGAETNSDQKNDTSTSTNDEPYIIDTEYYTISLPDSWRVDSYHEIINGDNSAYTLTFYDKAGRDSSNGGKLFSILLLTESEDYSDYPDHKVLGSLEVSQIGSFNIVVTYPTDVQFSETTAQKYNEMRGNVEQILDTISYKNECVFSTIPLPINKKDEFISRANGNWNYAINSTEGINLIIFGDGSFIKAYTTNGKVTPEDIITGTYKILSDDGAYQEFHFIPKHEQFEEWTAKIFQTQLADQNLVMSTGIIYISEDGTKSFYTGYKFSN